jgi:hypothetical protein
MTTLAARVAVAVLVGAVEPQEQVAVLEVPRLVSL